MADIPCAEGKVDEALEPTKNRRSAQAQIGGAPRRRYALDPLLSVFDPKQKGLERSTDTKAQT